MLKERIRFVFLRMLDREKLLEVIPYHITLHEVYSKFGYANFGTEPCEMKDYDVLFEELAKEFQKQREDLYQKQNEAIEKLSFNLLGRKFEKDEIVYLKEVIEQKYEQLFNYIDKQENIAFNIFFSDLKNFLYQEHLEKTGSNFYSLAEREEELQKILKATSLKNRERLVAGLKTSFL